jgi:hypothetical protein
MGYRRLVVLEDIGLLTGPAHRVRSTEMKPRSDLGRPRPRAPSGEVVGLVALAWLLIAVPIALALGGALLLGELLDERLGPLRVGPAFLLVIGGLALSLTAFGIAWLVVQVPNRRTLSISLIAALVLLGLSLVLQLSQGSISIQPDLILEMLVVLASGLGLWQAR